MSIPMEIALAIHEKANPLAWGWTKALPGASKSKVIKIAKNVKQLGQDDAGIVIHFLKVGLALTVVSLLYYSRSPYDGFGVSGMWAVLTVVVVFEFTVGSLAIAPAATVASILIEIVKCVDEISNSVQELSNLAHFRTVEPTVSKEKSQSLHNESVKPVSYDDSNQIVVTMHGKPADSPGKESTQPSKPG